MFSAFCMSLSCALVGIVRNHLALVSGFIQRQEGVSGRGRSVVTSYDMMI